MFGNKTNKPQNRIDCLIGVGTTVDGDITFEGGLRIDGHVKGNVIAKEGKPGTLILSEAAHLEGEIRVSHVVINCSVVGPVHASDYLELQAKANVIGDVFYRTLEMQVGAAVQGRLVYQDDVKADKVVKLKPVSAE